MYIECIIDYLLLPVYLSKPTFSKAKNVFESKESDDLESCPVRFDAPFSFKAVPPVNGANVLVNVFLIALDIVIKLCLQNIRFVR